MKRITLFAAALAVLPLAAVADNDAKTISPGSCQPYGGTSTYDTLTIRADYIRNATTNTNKYFICGLDRDSEEPWTVDEGGSLSMFFVYSGTGTIQCTRTIGTDLGAYVGSGDTPVTETVNAVAYVADLKIASFPEAAGFSHQPSAVTCRLPPGAKFSFAQTTENRSTDYDAPAP